MKPKPKPNGINPEFQNEKGQFLKGNKFAWKPGHRDIGQHLPPRKKNIAPLSMIRAQLQEVWTKVDGPAMMEKQAKKNPQWFLTSILAMLPKVKEIDLSLTVNADIRATVSASMEGTTKMLREMRAKGEMTGFSPFGRQPVGEDGVIDALPAQPGGVVRDVVNEIIEQETQDDEDQDDDGTM